MSKTSPKPTRKATTTPGPETAAMKPARLTARLHACYTGAVNVQGPH